MAIILAAAVIKIGFLIAKIWPVELIRLFNRNPALIDMGVHGMGIFFKLIPLVGVHMLGTSFFQATGRAGEATLLALSRQIFIFLPLLLILSHYWGLEGVW